ncbi:type 1 glutamine amidotransferase [Shimazuella sp. AN120528]|uniref:type 1 glutamine amidotransferase n=1 Tax=Shimazuella soli TaxID=1892854 RepID=UPI001F118160|nr:type 1 glutamine amidotransferase [Shimazuella soli]MCH5583719.1 type 1 glutamine amidotransferase [Shimazuella soli]
MLDYIKTVLIFLERSKKLHIHFVIHELFEGPGAFQIWAETRGYSIGYSRVYAGEKLPLSIEGIDLLIVLGGPQSPSTTVEECPHFDAVSEIALINKCIKAGKAVLGVCLGAQLIGEALGAKYEHSPEKEIGCFPITLTEEGKRSCKFSHFGSPAVVGHWHNDMPGLTEECKVIAYSEACPRQIIEYQNLVYGFQCHLEFNHELMELLIENSVAELSKSSDHRFVQQPEQLRKNDYKVMNENLFIFLDKLVMDYTKSE